MNNHEKNKKENLPINEHTQRINITLSVLLFLCLISAILSLFSNIYTNSFIEKEIFEKCIFDEGIDDIDFMLENSNLNPKRMFNRKNVINFIEKISKINSDNSLLKKGKLQIKFFSSITTECNEIYKLFNVTENCIKSKLNSKTEGDLLSPALDQNIKESKLN